MVIFYLDIINLSLNLKLYKSKTFLFLRNEESPYIPEFLEKYTIIEGLGSVNFLLFYLLN